MAVKNLISMTFAFALVAAPSYVAAQPPPYGGQSPTVTADDLQRLQDQAEAAGTDVSRLRDRDPNAADRLQQRLDDARDEIVYLKVRLRKEGAVSRRDYNDVRDKIDSVRADATGRPVDQDRDGRPWMNGAPPPPPPPPPNDLYGGTAEQQVPQERRHNEVPAGQQIDARIQQALSSETAQVEDRFTATTVVDLYDGNDILIPAGSALRGVVSSVTKATHLDRKGVLTLAFDQITVRGRTYPIHATVTQAIESQGYRGDAGKIGAGAGVGMILGGILGGAKGALLGMIVGGGGTIAATEGKDVLLPAGTVLRVQFDSPFLIR